MEAVSPVIQSDARLIDDDAILVARCKSGDTVAFGQLVSRHERRVRSIVSRILLGGASIGRDAAFDIDDIVQDIFIQSWKALGKFRGESRFSTWLFRIAANAALKEWKRQRRRGITLADDHFDEYLEEFPQLRSTSPQNALVQQLKQQEMQKAIEVLPEKQRTVILLHYYEGCSCEEIASMLHCSVGTIWSRLHYAMIRIRQNLDWFESEESASL